MDGAWFVGTTTSTAATFTSTRLVSTATGANIDTIKSESVDSQFANDARQAMRTAIADYSLAPIAP